MNDFQLIWASEVVGIDFPIKIDRLIVSNFSSMIVVGGICGCCVFSSGECGFDPVVVASGVEGYCGVCGVATHIRDVEVFV